MDVKAKSNPLDSMFGKRAQNEPVFGSFQAPTTAAGSDATFTAFTSSSTAFGSFPSSTPNPLSTPNAAPTPTPLPFVPPPITFADFAGPTSEVVATPFAPFTAAAAHPAPQQQPQPQLVAASLQSPLQPPQQQPQTPFLGTLASQPPAQQPPAQPLNALNQPDPLPQLTPALVGAPPEGQGRANLDNLIFKSFESAFSTAGGVTAAKGKTVVGVVLYSRFVQLASSGAARAAPGPTSASAVSKQTLDGAPKKSGVDWSNQNIRALLQSNSSAPKAAGEPEFTPFGGTQPAAPFGTFVSTSNPPPAPSGSAFASPPAVAAAAPTGAPGPGLLPPPRSPALAKAAAPEASKPASLVSAPFLPAPLAAPTAEVEFGDFVSPPDGVEFADFASAADTGNVFAAPAPGSSVQRAVSPSRDPPRVKDLSAVATPVVQTAVLPALPPLTEPAPPLTRSAFGAKGLPGDMSALPPSAAVPSVQVSHTVMMCMWCGRASH